MSVLTCDMQKTHGTDALDLNSRVPYFSRHEEAIRQLVSLTISPEASTASRAELVDLSQQFWYLNGHSTQADNFTDPLVNANKAVIVNEPAISDILVGSLQLVGEVTPPSDRYEVILGLGGLTSSLIRRFRFTAKNAFPEHQGEVHVLAGQRTRENRFLDDPSWPAAAVMQRHSTQDQHAREWIQGQSEIEGGGFRTEQELAILALMRVFRGVKLDAAQEVAIADGVAMGVDVLNIADRFNTSVFNAPTPTGLKRPTTESTVKDWLKGCSLPQNAKILAVIGNPHTERMTNQIKEILALSGRPDITVESAGPDRPYKDGVKNRLATQSDIMRLMKALSALSNILFAEKNIV